MIINCILSFYELSSINKEITKNKWMYILILPPSHQILYNGGLRLGTHIKTLIKYSFINYINKILLKKNIMFKFLLRKILKISYETILNLRYVLSGEKHMK